MSEGLHPGRKPLTWREFALASCGYLALTAFYWWPLIVEASAHYSVGRDYFQNTWNLWWTRFAWENGMPFLDCPWLFHPSGTSLAFHTISFANALPGLALQDWLELTQTHSVLFLSAFPFGALGVWALARYVSGSSAGAFLAGVFYSFNPYHTAMVTQLNNAQFHWVPLFLLSVLLLYDRGRWYYGAWAALTLALAGYADWYQPIFCAFAAAVLLGFRAWRDGRLGDVRLWLKLAAAGAAGALVMLPGALPIAEVMGEQYGTGEAVGIRYAGEMQLLGIHPQGSPFLHFWPVVCGYVTCALLVWALLRVRKRGAGAWWWLAGLSFLFLQGPYLVVLNRHFPQVPMPMALFPHLPVLSMIRVPHRFLLPLGIAVAVLLALALRELQDRIAARTAARAAAPEDAAGQGDGVGARQRPARARRLAGAAALLPALLLALELQPARREPVELLPAALYAGLAEDPEDYAVLELPIDFRDAYSMYLQTRHRKRLVGGYTSHILPDALAGLRTPLMRALMPAATTNDVGYLPEFEEVSIAGLDEATRQAWRTELLEEKGVRAIFFHHGPDFAAPEAALPGGASPTTAFKLRVALLPFRFNASVREVERWRQLAVWRLASDLAEESQQARQLIEELFGPPRMDGLTAVWDLRRL